MMKKLLIIVFLFPVILKAQSDSVVIKRIFNEELSNGKSYEMLDHLTNQIGQRLSGSPGAAKAVEWTKSKMEEYGFDTVYLQPVMVPHWVRGEKEKAHIEMNGKQLDVDVCALGNSVGTGDGGITAKVVEVQNFDQLAALGKDKIQGKIVYYSRPMDPTLIDTFHAYGGAVNQRGSGPSEAAKYGAVGVVVRSMTLRYDDIPHTGSTNYREGIPKIPAIAISTMDGELLHNSLVKDPDIQFYFETHSQMLDSVLSYNVVGELRGTEIPDEIIDVGGHLDSWDLGTGAHDDGTGCVESMEVLRLFKTLGIKNKRTIRAIMFMNEENGTRGGRKYAQLAAAAHEKHIAALESDSGGFTPRGFTMTGTDAQLAKFMSFAPYFKPYKIDSFGPGEGGADIGRLRRIGTALIGLDPDSQRYFDFHHTKIDRFEAVNKRELELGAAAMTTLVYLIDQNGM